MQTNEEVRAEVQKAVNGDGTTPPVVETPVAPADGVNPAPAEVTPAPAPAEPAPAPAPVTPANENVDPAKEQINNLNIALRQERESRKADAQKVAELESQIAELTKNFDVVDKIKGVFAPPQPTPEPEVPTYLTPEQAEEIWQKKEIERQQEEAKAKQLAAVQNEIATLEKEWDGTNGKPKYNDEEVLNWQKDNNKLYLSPTEAFNLMKRNELLDWEVKQRLNGATPPATVERPSGIAGEHTPNENLPKSEHELKKAVLEAMEDLDKGI